MSSTVQDNIQSTGQRDAMIARLGDDIFDVVVIGGGINGAVATAAATGKGAKVALLQASDFASGSSQESSTLAWGGIKYLENYEFKLVWDLCKSRNELMDHFPSCIVDTRFVTKIDKGFRKPGFLIYLGTLLYWAMGKFRTRAPQYLTKRKLKKLEPAISRENFGGAFAYSDSVYLDGDARFTFNFIKSAMTRGAVTLNYMPAITVKRAENGIWNITALDSLTGNQYEMRARTIVNTAGAAADKIATMANVSHDHKHILSKGAHLIVPSVTDKRHVITSFAKDGRLFFALPMAGNTCVGTTDEIVPTSKVEVNDADRDFILGSINTTLDLARPLTKNDIIAERCGVRPLVVPASTPTDLKGRDAFDISRKHVIDTAADHSFVTVYGGKLTDCINTGNEVCEELAKAGIKFTEPDNNWFGESSATEKTRFMARAGEVKSGLSQSPKELRDMLERWWRYYDVAAHELIEMLHPQSRFIHPDHDITDTEMTFIRETEMALTDRDIRRRRTNLSMAEGHEL